MAITASDIHNQSFSIDRKGYDVDEVDVFLEHVADEIDILNDTIAHLQDQLEADRFSGFDAPAASTVAITEVAAATVDTSEYDAQLARRTLSSPIWSASFPTSAPTTTPIAQASHHRPALGRRDSRQGQRERHRDHSGRRDEAQRIIDRANTDRQDVIDAIRKLQDDREDAREEYADLLKDIISDASASWPTSAPTCRLPPRRWMASTTWCPASPQLRDRRVRGAFRLRDAPGSRPPSWPPPPRLPLPTRRISPASATPTTSSSKRSTNQPRKSPW